MDLGNIFDMARELANVSENDYSDAKLLKYANKRYHDIENKIKKYVAQDYFYDIYTVDTIKDQNEYTFEVSTTDEIGMLDVIRLEIKRATDDTYYSLLKPSALPSLSTDKLESEMPQGAGFYEIKDSSIFIYPTPTSAVTDGLKMQCIINLTDLAVDSEEADIFPRHSELRQYQHIIALGLIADIFNMKRLQNDKMVAEQDYQQTLQGMLTELGNRMTTPIEGVLPTSTYYKY